MVILPVPPRYQTPCMNGMCQQVWCRLCLNNCNDYQSLLDDTDHCNEELFKVVVKYFHPTLLTTVGESPRTVICLECWRHISEFDNFKKNILLVQAKLVEHIKSDLSSGDEKLRGNTDFELLNGICGIVISLNYEKLLPKTNDEVPCCDRSNNTGSSQTGVKDDTEKSPIKNGDPVDIFTVEKLGKNIKLDSFTLRRWSADNEISTRTRSGKRRKH